MTEFKELIHFDKKMESAILGACLLEKECFTRVKGLLNKDCFYMDCNKQVFEILCEMWENNMPIDLFTVAQYTVRNKNISEMNGNNIPYHLTTLTDKVVNTGNIEYHSFLIRQLWAERRLIEIPYEIMSGDALGKVEKMTAELFKLSQIKTVDDWHDMDEVMIGLYKHMDEVKDKDIIGVPTGFSKFDRVTGGLIKGEITVLAARPSVGKSALLGAMAINAAQSHFKVGIISLEMSEVQIGARMGSYVSGADFFKIFRNQLEDREREDVYKHLHKLAELPIKISDKTKVNINDIRAKVGQLKSKGQLDVLFVDYLQLLDSEEGKKNYSREQEVAKMSRGFKLMSKEFNIPIVLLAQLNRESEKTANKKPQLGHLRESGAIEQDADLVVFLHRDWKAGILTNEMGQSTEHEADLIIAKGRNIETPEIKIGFDGSKMKFYDLDKVFRGRLITDYENTF